LLILLILLWIVKICLCGFSYLYFLFITKKTDRLF